MARIRLLASIGLALLSGIASAGESSGPPAAESTSFFVCIASPTPYRKLPGDFVRVEKLVPPRRDTSTHALHVKRVLDYVDVASRITEFYAKFGDGRLCTRSVEIVEGGALAIAEAYRTADDPHPGVGTAWEPIPGKTSFTRDSEVQNAETAAWGRAIIAVGIPSKKIASAEEVKARQPEPRKKATPGKRMPPPPPAVAPLSNEQKRIVIAAKTAGIDDDLRHRITRMFTGVTSVHEVSDDDCEKVAKNIEWFAANKDAAIVELEKWEAKNEVAA
jgi:hypothetical protein